MTAPIRAQDFVNSEGVNTHIPYTDGAYANVARIISDLQYLGINKVRDSINTPGQFGAAPFSSYVQVASAGIHFVFMVGGGGTFSQTGGVPTNPSLDQRVGYISALQQVVPGSVIGAEGTNEINNQPIIYQGLGASRVGQDELNASLALQRDLYYYVHNTPALFGVLVYYFTGYGAGTIPVGPNPYITTGLADADTQHPYPNGGQAPAYSVSRRVALYNESNADAASFAPAIYTETGYSSNGGTTGGVNLDVQAKYTLDLLLDSIQNQISSTYLYELMDAYAPGSPQGDAGFGLFDNTGALKPVAIAIHNMNAILTDHGSNATSFSATALPYTISGSPSTGNSLELAKSDGSYVIATWDEQSIWNTASATQIAAVPHQEMIKLGNGSQLFSVDLYDPMAGSAPIASFAQISSVTISITDHPLFINLRYLTKTEPNITPLSRVIENGDGIQPLYRFFDTNFGTQFLTASQSETLNIITERQDLILEQSNFQTVSSDTGVPVYRFFDKNSGSHFYTASDIERNDLQDNSNLSFEGAGFYEHAVQLLGDTPVYRFFDKSNGSHFFTASDSEYKSILNGRSDMGYEGVAFYAPT